MLVRGATWLASHVHEDGTIDPGDSTRILVESNRRGTPKRLPSLQIASALAWSAVVTGDEGFRTAAERIIRANQP
jgi:hypothetical protein